MLLARRNYGPHLPAATGLGRAWGDARFRSARRDTQS